MKAVLINLLLFAVCLFCAARPPYEKDSLRIFKDEAPLLILLTTSMKKLSADRMQSLTQQAFVQMQFPDSSFAAAKIMLNARGVYRRKNCVIPSIKLHFGKADSSVLKKLKDLKLVCPCNTRAEDEQLLLKEYLVYKIFNQLTEKSYNVRLAKITFTDSDGKRKPVSQYSFLIEDTDEMAGRNKCKELNNQTLHTENTNREQTTLVTIFQYMIGNTDWAVPNNHNIKLISLKKNAPARPFIVPYDFDFAGIVNAYYATPAPDLNISSVRDRVYRGFPRTMEELEPVINLFKEKKDSIYQLIRQFDLLTERNKEYMIWYLDEFYKLINSPANIKYEFISNARLE